MKETIYTIPLSEALEANDECAFCFLEDKLEKEQIEYALGPAMMEPDYRILSNEKGFCRRHIEKMARAKKALPLALVLDTRADEVLKILESVRPEEGKGGLFGKKGNGYIYYDYYIKDNENIIYIQFILDHEDNITKKIIDTIK